MAPPPSALSLLYPSTPIALPAAGSVPVHSDEPYSAFDRLFLPQVRAPSIAVTEGGTHFGLMLGGADRLELQRWMLAGYVSPFGHDEKVHWGGAAGYLNNMLAPVFVLAQGAMFDWSTTFEYYTAPNEKVIADDQRRTRDANALIGYTYRGSLTGTIGGVYTDDIDRTEGFAELHRYVAGPSTTLSWYSAESTRYTGARRALRLDGAGAYYPAQWSSFMGDIIDLGGDIGVTLPLPIGRRHTIHAFVRARSLVGQQDSGLLQVGGDQALGLLWNHSNEMPPPDFDTSRFPPNLRFVEPLRGFEDFAMQADRVKLGELSWRYPIIIDRGTASTLWFLPASYLRQLDLELFGTGALVDANDRHWAVGAAATLRIQFLRVPLAITYQIARRLSDDLALTQFVGIGPDL